MKIFSEFRPEELESSGFSAREFLDKLSEYGFRIHLIDEQKQSIEYIDTESLLKIPAVRMNLYLEK